MGRFGLTDITTSTPPVEWGYGHETVCHSAGEYARDDDVDGSERCTSTRWRILVFAPELLRPHRGSPEACRCTRIFEFVHNVRARGNTLGVA